MHCHVSIDAVYPFQQKLRSLVAEEHCSVQSAVQLGGIGVDVEMDEVNFRTQEVFEGGERKFRMQRYLCAAERHSRKYVLVPLPEKFVKSGSRTGAITNEELYQAMFPAGRPPLLLPGTVVHTDGAKAYRNLGWQGAPSSAEVPLELARELVGQRPSAWRWEWQEEADDRARAEAQEELGTVAGRTEEWASRYRHLRLVHTAVVHSYNKPGFRRQYVAMRRCHFQAEDAEVIRQSGQDMFLIGNVSWRKGGTQKVDGYWRLLRLRVANRGMNTCSDRQMQERVLVHQWSHTIGPGVELLHQLGATLEGRRRRQAVEVEVGERAWREAGEQEEDLAIPQHVPLPARRWVEQVWRRSAAVARGTRVALERRAAADMTEKMRRRVM